MKKYYSSYTFKNMFIFIIIGLTGKLYYGTLVLVKPVDDKHLFYFMMNL